MPAKHALDIAKANYATYYNEQADKPEAHGRRLFVQLSLSLITASTLRSLSDDCISVTVTALSILLGFAFSSVFSANASAVRDLPDPKFPEDFDEIGLIFKLSSYFRTNVSYFVPISLACIFLLLLQMLELSFPALLSCAFHSYESFAQVRDGIYLAINKLLLTTSIFLFLEVSYTFYRMCFTALALLRIKDHYLAERTGHQTK
ncbi:hypothetical protein [Sphingomonas sp. 8AM]|uniref:hypothetical protein n=1 Tax=Sphingomonas sp. 8AM TaxID=2653170 RepID=UPI0013584010|nr:hypothetical protein [Sphingomonas sp. 8AM]